MSQNRYCATWSNGLTVPFPSAERTSRQHDENVIIFDNSGVEMVIASGQVLCIWKLFFTLVGAVTSVLFCYHLAKGADDAADGDELATKGEIGFPAIM